MPLYQRLKSTKSEIRLLTLHPGECDTEIKCSLQVASLDLPCDFEALSYVWGDTSNLHSIIVDGTKFGVTVNLAGALHRLRHNQQPRVLWIDAICINQVDLEEKSTQIPLMCRIYSVASTVLVWLGEEDAKSMELAVSWTQTYVTKEITSPSSYWLALDTKARASAAAMREKYLAIKRAYLGCLNFQTNPYWTRIWTFQEFKVPPDEPLCVHGLISFRASLLIEGKSALTQAQTKKLPPQAKTFATESLSRLTSEFMPLTTDERGRSLRHTDSEGFLRRERQIAERELERASRARELASAEFDAARKENRLREEVKELGKIVIEHLGKVRRSSEKLDKVLSKEVQRTEKNVELAKKEAELAQKELEFAKQSAWLSSLINDRCKRIALDEGGSKVSHARRFSNAGPSIWPPKTELMELLYDTKKRHCTDPRDRVYALQGLLSDPRERHLPDYNKPVLQVMQDVTATVLNTPGEVFKAFALFSLRSERFTDTAYASWVLDFSSSPTYNSYLHPRLLSDVAGTINFADAESGTLHVGARHLGNCIVYARFDSDEDNIFKKLDAILQNWDITDNSGTMSTRQLQVFFPNACPSELESDIEVGNTREFINKVAGKALIKAGGCLGICSNDVRDGDLVVLPSVLDCPLILRREQTLAARRTSYSRGLYYRIVGFAYIGGICEDKGRDDDIIARIKRNLPTQFVIH